jgi:hypothetical protein
MIRYYDLGDLLAVAAAGQAEAAVVAAGTRWLDHDALARLAAAGLAVVGVAPVGDEDSERRLRQLGLHHVGADTDPPAALVDLARAALSAEPAPGPPPPPDAPPPPDYDLPHVLLAVWGPKGAPGRTTVAVNLAFEAAPWSARSCWSTPTPTAARSRRPSASWRTLRAWRGPPASPAAASWTPPGCGTPPGRRRPARRGC